MLSSNQLKLIACISMLIDHIGFFIFPHILIFRYIGRLAMPIFAFFIAEGCLKTSNIKAYFGRTFILAVFCQLFYIVEELIYGQIEGIYLNILFSLAFGIILCHCYISLKKSTKISEKIPSIAAAVFIILLLVFIKFSKNLGFEITLDYGITGVFLPLFGVMARGKARLPVFGLGLLLCCLEMLNKMDYIWLSFLALLLLNFYSGERGKLRLKYFFYAFYPLHLGAIYLIDALFFAA